MDTNKIFQSKTFVGIMFGIAALIILLVGFKFGMFVGVRKADFSCRWSDNYQRNFGGPRGGFLRGFGDRDFIESNGTVGQVIKIDGSTFIIKSRGNIEKIILVDDKTVINRLNNSIKPADLKIDDNVVIIGNPNNAGQIEAKFIRVLPNAPAGSPRISPK